MSPEQVSRFVRESIALGWEWRRIGLLGGELTLHPELHQILKILLSYRDKFPAVRSRFRPMDMVRT